VTFSDLNQIWPALQGWLALYGLRLLWTLIILVVGFKVARWLGGMVRRIMAKANLDETLTSFSDNILRFLLRLFVIIAALNQLGFQTASLVALLGAVGLAVGLALQGNLANFAAGVIILLFRPFKLGDVIESSGSTGAVQSITILNTTLKCPDGRIVIIPNNKLISDKIINYSLEEVMRADLVVGISYSDDIPRAKAVLRDVVSQNKRVLADPEPQIFVLELADSSVNLAVRAYVKKENYWNARWELNEAIKLRFDQEGISIPFPQQDVHIFKEDTQAAA